MCKKKREGLSIELNSSTSIITQPATLVVAAVDDDLLFCEAVSPSLVVARRT